MNCFLFDNVAELHVRENSADGIISCRRIKYITI